MSKKEFKTREEVLQDSINYFWGRPERRCVNIYGCSYTPSRESEGCAIGRLVELEVAEKLAKTNDPINKPKQMNLLPKWLGDMGVEFLDCLQTLHDMNAFEKKDIDYVQTLVAAYVDMGKITFPE